MWYDFEFTVRSSEPLKTKVQKENAMQHFLKWGRAFEVGADLI